MSSQNQIGKTFEAQRESIDAVRTLLRGGVEVNQQLLDAFVRNLKFQQQLQAQATEMNRRLLTATITAMGAWTDADLSGTAETVEESFDAVSDLQDESWEQTYETIEEGASFSEQMTEEYLETTEESFDAFLDAHERVETQVTAAVETVDSVTEPAE